MRILLAGQPNCGKTTLFNALTGRRAPTGNRPGVTVEAVRGIIRGTEDMLLDLPGLYALSGGGTDEALARQQLEAYAPDLILNVLDMTALERSLPLTLALCRYQKPMAVLLNMADEGERLGLQLDVPELERIHACLCLAVILDAWRKCEGFCVQPGSPGGTRHGAARKPVIKVPGA